MPKSLNDHQIRRIAFCFTLFLGVFEIYAIGVNYSSYFVYVLDLDSTFFLLVDIVFMLLAFFLFFRFVVYAISASWPYKALCFLIFAVSVLIEYGYEKALGRFSDKIDIATAIATTSEQRGVAIRMFLNLYTIVPCIVLLVLFVACPPQQRRGLKGFLFALAPILLVFIFFPYVGDHKFPTLATNAFLRTTTDFLISGADSGSSYFSGETPHRREVPRPELPQDHQPKNNIIVLVGESILGDHLSLNGYGRETTPVLDKLAKQGILHNWGIAAAASTGSRFTYSALITGLTPDDFPDPRGFRTQTAPTVFQYAKAMGYKTHFFDGQMNGYWGGVEDDKNYFDDWQGVQQISDHMPYQIYEPDNLIAKKVKDIIYSSSGNLIFVFMHGAHIPYNIDFPPDQKTWTPSYEATNKFDIPSADVLPEVVNAYDNAIKYNVNTFFSNLIDDYSSIPNNTIIIYTGDHGQTLFVNGRSSHGGNTKAEATVPLFMVGKIPSKVDTTYKASHANIFPTILDLLDYPKDGRGKRGFPSLFDAKGTDSRARYFNPDLGTKVPFD